MGRTQSRDARQRARARDREGHRRRRTAGASGSRAAPGRRHRRRVRDPGRGGGGRVSLVLVVDDEPQIRRALRTSLEAHGWEVATVGTGEEGVLGAAEIAPDLMLLDLGLPGHGRRRRSSARIRTFSDVPVIVLSVREAQHGQGGGARRRRRRLRHEAVRDGGAAGAGSGRGAAGAARGPDAARHALSAASRSISRGGSVTRDGEQVHLTPTEYGLLEALVTNPGQAPHAPMAPAQGLGAGLRHRDHLPAHLHAGAAEEARRRRAGPRAHHHRARRRLSVDRRAGRT